MTVRVCRTCGEGIGVPYFTKLSETPFKALIVKNVKLKSDSHPPKKCMLFA